MYEAAAERKAIWDAFLARWPLETLAQMSLEQYSESGNTDSFTYWLEVKTETLGSIWGGSAFKFGVYGRKDKSPKPNEGGACYTENHGWLQKYGASPEEAFAAVRMEIVRVAKAARAGNLAEVEAADLGPAIRWKIAFLYQNREKPCVLPIYKLAYLQAAANQESRSAVDLQQELIRHHPNGQDLFEYSDEVWGIVKKKIEAELTPEQAREYLETTAQYRAFKPPTEKIAGYESPFGHQVALALNRERTIIYLRDGKWLTTVQSQLEMWCTTPRGRPVTAIWPQMRRSLRSATRL
jgi:5-methylcytosine-specific restriction protein B